MDLAHLPPILISDFLLSVITAQENHVYAQSQTNKC